MKKYIVSLLLFVVVLPVMAITFGSGGACAAVQGQVGCNTNPMVVVSTLNIGAATHLVSSTIVGTNLYVGESSADKVHKIPLGSFVDAAQVTFADVPVSLLNDTVHGYLEVQLTTTMNTIDLGSFTIAGAWLGSQPSNGSMVYANSGTSDFIYAPIGGAAPGGVYRYQFVNGTLANITFTAGQDDSHSGVQDSSQNTYWMTSTNPAKIIRVQDSSFTETNTTSLSGVNSVINPTVYYNRGVSDKGTGFAYFAQTNGFSKYNMSTFAEDAFTNFNLTDVTPQTDLILIGSGYIFIVHEDVGTNVRVLQYNASTMTLMTSLLLSSTEETITTGSIDTTNKFLYLCSYVTGDVVKVSYQ